MPYTTDTIKQGETYNWSISAKDENGNPIVIPGTWTAVLRVTKAHIDGPTVITLNLNLTPGASNAVDTEDWKPGIYFYDVRFTDNTGNDFWSDPVKLVVEARNAPAS